jgi:hypothetical protein
VDCSNLNGENVETIYEATDFGEVKLVSLTLDAKSHNLYLMILVSTFHSSGKIQVLRFKMTKQSIPVEVCDNN